MLGLLFLSAASSQEDGSQYIDLVANPAYPYTSDVWGYIDSTGPSMPSGIYIARLVVWPQAGNTAAYTKSIKMLLLK